MGFKNRMSPPQHFDAVSRMMMRMTLEVPEEEMIVSDTTTMDGLQSTVHAMNMYPHCATLQTEGLRVILLGILQKPSNHSSFTTWIRSGGMETIVMRAMQRFPLDPNIQRLGVQIIQRYVCFFPARYIQDLRRNQKLTSILMNAANVCPQECRGHVLQILYKLSKKRRLKIV
eukprot:scaffold10201_cov49-Attheya_sp.AAC.2